MQEQKRRSISKAITYRVAATVTTFSIALIFTGNIELATTIGLIDSLVKFFLFYINERLWIKTNWGYQMADIHRTTLQKNKEYESETRQHY